MIHVKLFLSIYSSINSKRRGSVFEFLFLLIMCFVPRFLFQCRSGNDDDSLL